MALKNRGSLLPLTYVFASFIGAAMVAATFAYDNYRFSKYKFLDFSQIIFYEKNEIFKPESDKFLLVFFSSNMDGIGEILQNKAGILPVVAVDLQQKRIRNEGNVTFVTADINAILKAMNLLNVRELPSEVEMIHQDKKIYKQNSKINKI